MTRFISFTNGLGKEYIFNNILSLNGFDSAPVTHITTQNSGQDGATYRNSFFSSRDIEITFDIFAAKNASIETLKRNIITRLSPKSGEGVLRYVCEQKDLALPCVPDSVAFTKQSTEIYTGLARFKAFMPYFIDSAESKALLKFVESLLVFPVTFPCIFGQRTNIGTVTNTGDAPAPVVIRFYNGVTNPTFTNLTTGEYIKLNGVIPADSILEIDTAYGVKSVSIITEGSKINAFSLLDPTSNLWSLPVGPSRIEYTAEAENDDSYGEIVYYNRYVGV